MAIWKKDFTQAEIDSRGEDTLAAHLGIEIDSIGDDFLIASMPVDKRTHQPMGILHGGASIALAETVGSIAANLAVDKNHFCVGLEVNGNHLKQIARGKVFAKAIPLHLGRSTQIWDIKIRDSEEKLICVSRLTMAVLSKT